ncbi:50S ribosome-binding GTPase [bacterium]|nr:50S ribosome-binding GTPase [bacterium]
MSKLSRKQQCQFLYLLVGTPNVGKSTIFNHLTTSVALVSNIDRMTTEHTTGCLKHEKNFHIVDLPGVYNLSHPIAEEHEVNYHLIKHNITGIVNVIAAKSLERDLYLTLQTLETGMLSTLVINMTDSINVSTFQ